MKKLTEQETGSTWIQWSRFIRRWMPTPRYKPYQCYVQAVRGQHAHLLLIDQKTKQKYHLYAELMYSPEAHEELPIV